MNSSVGEHRLEFIDFMRGVAIVEMLVTHYSLYFPPTLGTIVSYGETAMPASWWVGAIAASQRHRGHRLSLSGRAQGACWLSNTP